MAVKRRVVVVGVGSIGRRHTRLLLERDDVQVELVEPNAETLASARTEFGELAAHESFESMLATQPDIVWLASPTSLHAAQSIAALQAGAHVFCEKPMTYTLQEAEGVLAIAERSLKVFNVGFYLHFWTGMALLKGLIERGELGSVLYIHAHVGSYVTLVNSRSRYQAKLPGSLFFDYSHQPDLFYWLMRKIPVAVQVLAFRGGALEFTSDPNVADLISEYDSPLVTHIHLNYVQMPQRHTYEVTGDEGWAFLDFDKGLLLVGNRRQQRVNTKTFEQDRDDIVRAEHDAFFEAVDGKRSPESPASDGMISTAICVAAFQSYQSRQRVPVMIKETARKWG